MSTFINYHHPTTLFRSMAGFSSRATIPGVFYSPKPVISSTSISPLRCNAVSKSHAEVVQNGFPATKDLEQIVEEDTSKVDTWDKVKEGVETIRSMLKSMEDGEISISPYDTAWVAMVADNDVPQFPSSLEWISNNQLEDGSWGDEKIFSIYDRILNTLGCVVALTTWNIQPQQIDKGILFIKEHIHKLEEENEEHMPIGFEVALPSLIEIAKKLEIDIPLDSPGVQEIYKRRNLKLTKIPKEIMHKVPTTLLHSLEGMPDLVWEKLLKLQSADGSFLFSPSSTAFALHHTKDQNCFNYLSKHLLKFNGGVPNVYPVDMFEHIWAVDRLQRLGISRYFNSEIQECVDYINRYWTEKGICWARNSEVQDIDDTAMAFRLQRMHGYDVSPDVFKHFEKNGEFFCFAGQSNQAVTGMYNLYRASQLMFPGENILENASKFSLSFLKEKRANNELLDKWIITKDLPGEVTYALDVPFYASLPRLEARFFLEQYGGEDDVWIGKTLYRMPFVNNNTYLEVAKVDYNNCQELHQQELRSIQKWYKSYGLEEFGISERSLLQAYYIAAAIIFEPEKAPQRIAWAKTTILTETIASHFESQQLTKEQKRDFIEEFKSAGLIKFANVGRYKTGTNLMGALMATLNQISLDVLLTNGQDIYHQLVQSWHKWLKNWEDGVDGLRQGDAVLFIETLNLTVGGTNPHHFSNDHPKHQQLLKATTNVCNQLSLFHSRKGQVYDSADWGEIATAQIESKMQEIVKSVVSKCDMDLDSETKQTFLDVARSFYYRAYYNDGAINSHIAKVLFEKVQ